jgi:hypothetical protein
LTTFGNFCGRSKIGPLLPDDISQALLKINDQINALLIDPVEQRVLREEVEILVLKLAEASSGILFVIPSEGD